MNIRRESIPVPGVSSGTDATRVEAAFGVDDREICPYCGQKTHDAPLIQMYQSFSNAAYEELIASVNQVMREVAFFTDPVRWEEIQKRRSTINERSARWVAYADVNLLDASKDELAETSLENPQELLVGLLSRKPSQ